MKALLVRFLRFRLRTLMVVVTLCCLYLGLVVRKAEQQKEAVAWIKQSIGSSAEIVYDYELTGTATRNIAAIRPGPDWLRKLIGIDYFADVVSVRFGRGYYVESDEQMAALPGGMFFAGRLDWDPKLRAKMIPPLTDLSPLAKLTSLRFLDISGDLPTDITPLANLTNLRTLCVRGTRVTDLSPLAGLHNLETLDLSYSTISDLSPLAHLTKLRRLNIQGTFVRPDEITALKESIPNVYVTPEGGPWRNPDGSPWIR